MHLTEQSHRVISFQAPFVSAMADEDPAEALRGLLSELQVPELLQTALFETGSASIGDFAFAYVNVADLSAFLQAQPQSVWDTLRISNPEHSPAAARLRRALERCKTIAQLSDGASAAASASTAVQPAIAQNVWAEHAPPHLDAEAVAKMVQEFRATYSGERVDADSMPSVRLLSLVHCWFRPRGKIKWVPWQLQRDSTKK